MAGYNKCLHLRAKTANVLETTGRTHMAQFLHVGHQQWEAVSEGRVVLCADLLDQRAQQHFTIIGDGQDGCQLD